MLTKKNVMNEQKIQGTTFLKRLYPGFKISACCLAIFLLGNFQANAQTSSSEPSVVSARATENPWKGEVHKISPEKKDKTISLFNGEDLKGWYTFLKGRGRDNDPKKVFTVQNKMIRISGEEWGCITTDKEYENYKLVVEFKWGGKTFAPRENNARDCGVLVHSVGPDGAHDSTWMNSIECQVIEGGTGDFIVVGDGTEKFSLTSTVAPEQQNGTYVFKPGGAPATIHGGRINWYARDPQWKDVKDFRGAKDIEKPVGQWNRMECIVKGDEITIYLNGTLVNHGTNAKPSKGRIQIQSESAEILFRKVELTPLK
jgi:hypothetical protein